MTETTPKNKPRFSIEGDIKAHDKSSHLKGHDRPWSGSTRSLITLLIVLLLAVSAFAVWLLLKNQTLTGNEPASATESTRTSPDQTSIDSLKEMNDSLLVKLTKLELANDLLVENSDQLTGIFFEVHLNFSGDFDLDQYQEELAHLKVMEYDDRSGLVLGRFRSFKKALLFENDLKKMGVTDIYLLGRVDGKIMTFKEAMGLAQNQNN